jgi:hypothetical protein
MKSRKEQRKAELKEAVEDRYKRRQAIGAALTRQAYQLREISDREKLLEAAIELFERTRDDVLEVRKSTHHDSHCDLDDAGDALEEGDMYTSQAEDIAGLMRENVCNPQTVWEALSEALPDVHFTVDWHDAVSIVAAMLREARQLGVVDGLELANAADAKSNMLKSRGT